MRRGVVDLALRGVDPHVAVRRHDRDEGQEIEREPDLAMRGEVGVAVDLDVDAAHLGRGALDVGGAYAAPYIGGEERQEREVEVEAAGAPGIAEVLAGIEPGATDPHAVDGGLPV